MSNVHEHTTNALDAIVARAVVNRQFRAHLLTDPHATLREALGAPLPPNFTVQFIEKDPGIDAVLVLPDLVPEGGPLPLATLDSDATGGVGQCWWTQCGVTEECFSTVLI